ncbi:MAG: hypothetical protein ACRD1A_06505 [Terriglobales bacterium]
MPRRLIPAAALAGLLLLPLSASNPYSFTALQHRIEVALRARPVHPHLLGFAAFVGRITHPHLAGGLRLAVFPAPAGADLDALARAALAPGWYLMVRTVNRDSGEAAHVYVRERGHNFQMLVLALDPSGDDGDSGGPELALVELNVNPRELVLQADQRR